jgi:hypothetical protein
MPGKLKAASDENRLSDCSVVSTVIGPIPLSSWVSFMVADSIPVALLPSCSKNDNLKAFCPTANGLMLSFMVPSAV